MANEEAIACELQEITDNLHEAAKENSQSRFLTFTIIIENYLTSIMQNSIN